MFNERKALNNAAIVLRRSIHLSDVSEMVLFHEALSDQTIFTRYFQHLPLATRVDRKRLEKICSPDGEKSQVYVLQLLQAPSLNGEGRLPRPYHRGAIIGVGRLSLYYQDKCAETSLLIADDWQGQGLGAWLKDLLIKLAHNKGVHQLQANIRMQNHSATALARKQGYQLKRNPDSQSWLATIDIQKALAASSSR